ncbi:MAG: zinc ribbon domain-containing protein [Lachnospiraceae bacterium]|nr:zinc ribbon domain-containing protein [Candidatus Merdinaster equi]
MFCPNCGSQVPDGIAFCRNCGTPMRDRLINQNQIGFQPQMPQWNMPNYTGSQPGQMNMTGYQQNMYENGAYTQEPAGKNALGIVSMILGIVAVVVSVPGGILFGFIPGIVGLLLGIGALILSIISKNNGGTGTAGLICGIIGMVMGTSFFAGCLIMGCTSSSLEYGVVGSGCVRESNCSGSPSRNSDYNIFDMNQGNYGNSYNYNYNNSSIQGSDIFGADWDNLTPDDIEDFFYGNGLEQFYNSELEEMVEDMYNSNFSSQDLRELQDLMNNLDDLFDF